MRTFGNSLEKITKIVYIIRYSAFPAASKNADTLIHCREVMVLSPKLMSRRFFRDSSDAALQQLCLALLFSIGALAGWLYAKNCAEESLGALEAYLSGYCRLFSQGEPPAVSLADTLRLYCLPTALAVLLGFSTLGVAAIPLLSTCLGFLAMFAVACFTFVFDRSGVIAAAAALGVRLLFSLPCFFSLGALAWSLSLQRLTPPKGKRCEKIRCDSGYYACLLRCALFLALGIAAERTLTPYLFHLALQGL